MDCQDEPIKITMLFLLAKQGAETYPMTPDQFGMSISDEIKKWAAVSEASIVTSDLRQSSTNMNGVCSYRDPIFHLRAVF